MPSPRSDPHAVDGGLEVSARTHLGPEVEDFGVGRMVGGHLGEHVVVDETSGGQVLGPGLAVGLLTGIDARAR